MAFHAPRCSPWPQELGARFDPAAEDIASEVLRALLVYIADAMNTIGGTGLWDEEDGFYYDQMHVDGRRIL